MQSSTLYTILQFLLRSDLFTELGNRHIWMTKERQLHLKTLLQIIDLCNMLLILMAELGINMFHQTYYQLMLEILSNQIMNQIFGGVLCIVQMYRPFIMKIHNRPQIMILFVVIPYSGCFLIFNEMYIKTYSL